ncbi:TPA: hypothetical protein N0F65_012395, partial [Lagenidium giganteum]
FRQVDSASEVVEEETFVQAAEKRVKQTSKVTYVDTRFVPPASNECERFFSSAKLVFSDPRKSMHPDTLEDILMLRYNSSLLDARTIQQVRSRVGDDA